jgi:hypothetical protein
MKQAPRDGFRCLPRLSTGIPVGTDVSSENSDMALSLLMVAGGVVR